MSSLRDDGGAELVQVRERRGLAGADAAGQAEPRDAMCDVVSHLIRTQAGGGDGAPRRRRPRPRRQASWTPRPARPAASSSSAAPAGKTSSLRPSSGSCSATDSSAASSTTSAALGDDDGVLDGLLDLFGASRPSASSSSTTAAATSTSASASRISSASFDGLDGLGDLLGLFRLGLGVLVDLRLERPQRLHVVAVDALDAEAQAAALGVDLDDLDLHLLAHATRPRPDARRGGWPAR